MERAARFSTRPLIPGSVEWSDDNQVASTTFKVVQLATPRTKSSGQLVIDQTSIPSSVAPKQDPDIVNALQLSPAESLHPVGYWREGFKRSGWSPAGCSALGGCLLATISTHHSVAIWAPIDDPAVGEWEPIQDVNPELRNVAGIYTSAGEIVPEKLATISTMSVAWSPLHETKGHCPAPLRCSYGTSILSVGTKAGTVVLWRYVEGELKDGFEFKAHKSWVLNLAWSGWRQEVDYEYAYLATSASDGSVRVWSVISRFTESHDEPRQRKVSVQLWAEVEKEDARGMAILSFMHASSEVLPFRLAFTKGRTAGVWLAPQSGLTPHPRSDPLTNSDADFDIALEAHPVVLRCRLPQTMGASAACWDSVGEELTIYTTDGQCFLLALDDDNDPYTFMTPGSSHLSLLRAGLSPSYSSLSLLEDLTATLYRDLIVTSTMEDLIKEATEGKEDGANADEQQSGQEKDGEMSAAELWGKAGKQIRLSGAANSAGGLYHALVYFYAYPDEVNYTTYKSFTSDLLIRPNFTQENNAGGDDELYRLNMDLEDIGEAGLEESLEHKVPRRVKDVIDRNLLQFWPTNFLLWDIIQASSVVLFSVDDTQPRFRDLDVLYRGTALNGVLAICEATVEHEAGLGDLAHSHRDDQERRLNSMRVVQYISTALYMLCSPHRPNLRSRLIRLMRTTDDSLNDTYVHSLTTHLASELVNGFRVQKGLDLQFLVLAMTAALSRWKPLTSGETLALRDIMEYLDLMHHDMIYPQLGISATDPVGLMYDGILARLRSSLNDPANRPIPLPPPAFEACRICQSAIIVNNDVEVLNEDGTVTRVSEGVGPETGAVCENGHMWERCVSTYFILDQPCTRACMNCENGSLSLASPGVYEPWKETLAGTLIAQVIQRGRGKCWLCGCRIREGLRLWSSGNRGPENGQMDLDGPE